LFPNFGGRKQPARFDPITKKSEVKRRAEKKPAPSFRRPAWLSWRITQLFLEQQKVLQRRKRLVGETQPAFLFGSATVSLLLSSPLWAKHLAENGTGNLSDFRLSGLRLKTHLNGPGRRVIYYGDQLGLPLPSC
jgi:hypothetical protein